MLTATDLAGGVLWAALVGVGSGSFPLALTMIALRTRTADATASLSAFAQSVGYVLPAAGPLLVGVLHGRSGGWTGSFVLLFAALGRHGRRRLVRRPAALRRGRGRRLTLRAGARLRQRLERLREALRRWGDQARADLAGAGDPARHAGVDLRQDAGARDLQHVDAGRRARGSRAPARRTPGSRRA
jgi:MFS family permease